MEPETQSTRPKPFVFVLMPFEPSFDDIYKFGIKGAAEEAGAYAERVDEQIFTEGILDRVFNQINKADVIVADMTRRNPNVFYEVGYAHALGKTVLLLTQRESDIPFDLQQHQHIIYEGKIDKLRSELVKKIRWAITEARNRQFGVGEEKFEITINDISVPSHLSKQQPPLVLKIPANENDADLSAVVRNISFEASEPVSYIYLFTKQDSEVRFHRRYPTGGRTQLASVKAHSSDAAEGLVIQYRLSDRIPSLPPGTFETIQFLTSVDTEAKGEEHVWLRLHTSKGTHSYAFKLQY